MSVTHQAAVHLGRDYSLNLRSVKNQSSKSVEHLFRTTEKLIKEQTGLCWTSPCGENHLCCVVELFELWNPKSMSFLTRCYAWEASVQNHIKLGNTNLNGIWKHDISKNWIEWSWRRIDGIRVEKFPRIHYIGDADHPFQRARQRGNQQFEGLEEYDCSQTGWRFRPSKSQGNLRHPTFLEVEQVIFFSDAFSLAGKWIPWHSTVRVDRYTCRTPHFHMHSHCTDHTAQMTCVHGSSLSSVSRIGHSSTRHVSLWASHYTEHQHQFSLAYLTCVTVVLFSEPRSVVHASIYPLLRSTAGSHFCGIPLLHMVMSPRGSNSTGIWSIHKIK